MLVLFEDASEERRTCGKNHFVGLHLFFFAGQGDVKEVFVLSQLSKGNTDVALKVIPPKTELVG